jgi:ATP-dependent RNA helicase RhlE
MQFADLKLSPPILRALEIEGYSIPTPIQTQAIPHVLSGKDVLGCAQTGTGKTAAFALPILHRLHAHPSTTHRKPRVLVLCPTRELATQIGHGFKAYGREVKVRYSVIFGGVSQQGQVDSLRSGVDIVVACPGRLLDLMNQGYVDLSQIDTLVLDEADRMLDMGFIHDIRRIITKIPTKRQTLFFSATMPPEIRKLADTILREPVTVRIAPASAVADRIEESVYFVNRDTKPTLLAHLVKDLPMYRAIVFTRTKHGADKVVKKLAGFGIQSAAIHGNKSQNNRNRALTLFKTDKIGVLVATDIAARGIDIDGVTHVVNFDVTHEPETYIHRIGRTARAGASGKAISFCDHEERQDFAAIEKLVKRKIAAVPLPEGMPPPPPRERENFSVGDSRNPSFGRQQRNQNPSRQPVGGGVKSHGATKSHGGGRPQGGRPAKPAGRGFSPTGQSGRPQARRQPAGAGRRGW